MRRQPVYTAWIIILIILLLSGIGLLLFGSSQQGPLPRPTLTVPSQVLHG